MPAKTFTPDQADVKILIRVMGPRPSTYEEMGIDLGVGTSVIQYRILRMVDAGVISKPMEKKSRSLTLTEKGKEILIRYGVKVVTF